MKSKRVLQNASYAGCHVGNPSIKIEEGEPSWQEAYTNWLNGKPPTNSPDWQLGVHLHFEPINEPEPVIKPSVFDKYPLLQRLHKAGKIAITILGLIALVVATALYWLILKLG